ncbi:MAG: LytR C-terminal domain-containing protein [Patescibacteria group bacterium]
MKRVSRGKVNMPKTLDLHRRRKPAPPQPPARTDRRAGVGLFIMLFILAIIISLASNKVASDNLPISLQPTPTPIPTVSKITPPTPSPTRAPSPSTSPTPSPTPSATPSPSPTETTPPPPAEPDKSTISMRILNGSGTSGQAATLQTTLKKNGFTVRSIATAKTRRATGIIYYATSKQAEAEFVASFITNRVLEFEENPALAKPDTLLIIVGAK